VHGPRPPQEGPIASSIVPASTFRFRTIAELAAANAGEARHDSFYTRYGNPNFTALEARVADLEGAEASLVFSTGMAAIAAVATTFLRPGTRLVATSDLYGGTIALFRELLAPWGVEVVFTSDAADLERACRGGAALVYVETPTNPLCRIVDLRRARDAARIAGAPLACDATFASPVNQATIAGGADLSIQSATKYLGGHADLMGGTVAGSAALIAKIERVRRKTGGIPDPEQAWRIERSLKTLPLRVERQNSNALALARFLEGRRGIERVWHCGLPSHPDHEIARRQMRGFGGMLSFDVAGGEPAARRFAEALQTIAIAPSLGGVETLVSPPIHTSHASMPLDERRRAGIADGTLRLSVGVEDVEDLVADLARGLAACAV